MGSMSNPNPWAPYDSYNDCSHGICNIYCPQWCYILFPPPPPSFFEASSSNNNFSPLLIALIGVLTFALILISYYTLISKYCHRRRDGSFSSNRLFSSVGNNGVVNAVATGGLNQSLINSITVYKYRKGDGFVDGSDCSVCLSEFQENENLRLLPKCNHAFHLPCIDTWLKSHSNCPLCRAFVTGITPPVIANQPSSVHQIATEPGDNDGGIAENDSITTDPQHETTDFVIVIPDLETRSRNELITNINTRSNPKPQQDSRDKEEPQQIRRSVSLNSVAMVSIADIVQEFEDNNKRDEESGSSEERGGGEGEHSDGKMIPLTANQRNGVSSFLVRSSTAMKRSVSTGRFILPRYDCARNYRLPN